MYLLSLLDCKALGEGVGPSLPFCVCHTACSWERLNKYLIDNLALPKIPGIGGLTFVPSLLLERFISTLVLSKCQFALGK